MEKSVIENKQDQNFPQIYSFSTDLRISQIQIQDFTAISCQKVYCWSVWCAASSFTH